MNFDKKIFHFCPKNHLLKWTFTNLTRPCPLCNKTAIRNISRWMCTKCDEKYCVFCKEPQIFNNKCPLNHELIQKKLENNDCDSCRKPIKGKAFRDEICDFDLCEICMYDLVNIFLC